MHGHRVHGKITHLKVDSLGSNHVHHPLAQTYGHIDVVSEVAHEVHRSYEIGHMKLVAPDHEVVPQTAGHTLAFDRARVLGQPHGQVGLPSVSILPQQSYNILEIAVLESHAVVTAAVAEQRLVAVVVVAGVAVAG